VASRLQALCDLVINITGLYVSTDQLVLVAASLYCVFSSAGCVPKVANVFDLTGFAHNLH
jgi:hypothetical protein